MSDATTDWAADVDELVECVDEARMLLEPFGRLITMARKDREVTMRDLAENIGIPAYRLTYIERAMLCPTPEQLTSLRDWLLQQPLSDEQPTAD